ncbi:SAM-dependent methyltransferase [Paractinoplanes hotanensis]|uniref:S-adenosyl-L-methionine-dependent methyltransferase n=1 Tax=Paractinoplanes hotanensis TaxID=2906497 RepID=A0ABT0YET6_9ACTN|nr:SAM-dependent methyltransferase [Actinoplanes hotanensis]MCM4084260.1 SAM-dependent methyltransferase [Actinoplanes hotanensis]
MTARPSATGLPMIDAAHDEVPSGPANTSWFAGVSARTAFHDRRIVREHLMSPQIVVLGAGPDDRAFRLNLHAGTTIFEVDRPSVLFHKQWALDRCWAVPHCRRVPVPLSPAEPVGPALCAAGFDRLTRAVWVAEDLLVHLTAEQANRLLADISALSAPGSHLTGAYRRGHDATTAGRPAARNDRYEVGPWLTAHGWYATAVTGVASLPGTTGRPATSGAGTPVQLFDAEFTAHLSPHLTQWQG